MHGGLVAQPIAGHISSQSHLPRKNNELVMFLENGRIVERKAMFKVALGRICKFHIGLRSDSNPLTSQHTIIHCVFSFVERGHVTKQKSQRSVNHMFSPCHLRLQLGSGNVSEMKVSPVCFDIIIMYFWLKGDATFN